MRFIFLLLLIAAKSRSNPILQHVEDTSMDYYRKLIACANSIAERHFKHPHIAILARNPINLIAENFLNFVKIVGNDSNFLHKNNRNVTKHAVIFLEGNSFQDDVRILRSLDKFHPQGRYIICVRRNDDAWNLRSYLKKMAEVTAVKKKPYVIFLTNTNRGKRVLVYGHTIHGYNNCDRVELVDHGNCESDETMSQIFAKYLNFNRCQIRLVAFILPPYIEIDMNKEEQFKTRGTMSHALNLIVEKVNATANFLRNSTGGYHVDGSDIRGMIRRKEADLGWGLMMQLPMEGITYPKSLFITEANIIMPKSEWPIWMNLLFPFQREVWMYLGLLVSSVVILNALFPFCREKFPAMYIVAGLFGIGVPKKLSLDSQRLFLLSWTVFGFILINSYSASLTGLITKPIKIVDIETLEQLDKSQVPVGGINSMREQFREMYPRIYRDYQIFNKDQYFDNVNKLQSGSEGIATHIILIQMLNATRAGQNGQFNLIPEVISFYPIAPLAPESSALLPACDSVISNILESGLQNLWSKRSMEDMRESGSTLENDPQGTIGVHKMTLAYMEASIFVLCVGFSISTAVFLIELKIGARQSY